MTLRPRHYDGFLFLESYFAYPERRNSAKMSTKCLGFFAV
jgi:hypothetical protein